MVNAPDASSLYEIPLVLHDEGLDAIVCRNLGFGGDHPAALLDGWRTLVDRIQAATDRVKIGIVGKYVALPDAYLSVVESLNHAGFAIGCRVDIEWIQAEDVEGMMAPQRLGHLDGIVIPGGFGPRGIEGKITAAGYARESATPCLGLCLGLQVMTIDYARSVLGMERANSSEVDPDTPYPVIDLMDTQRSVTDMGGTMRLGAYIAKLEEGSQVAEAYGQTVISERHRHRYEVNPRYRSRFDDGNFVTSGLSPDGLLVEFIELRNHPFWVGTQAHPEFKSRPERPAPLFLGLMRAAHARFLERTARVDLTSYEAEFTPAVASPQTAVPPQTAPVGIPR